MLPPSYTVPGYNSSGTDRQKFNCDHREEHVADMSEGFPLQPTIRQIVTCFCGGNLEFGNL